MRLKQREVGRRDLRPLNKHEIDLRIEALICDLARAPEDHRAEGESDGTLPCTISARELVRRMRPFLGLN